MQIIENTKLKEKVYIEKLKNGLTVMIIPKKATQKKYVMWATHYGSVDNEFIVPGEKEITKVPDGVAHFLEHKMFEQENGTNSLDTLTMLGVNANAYTTTDHTAFLFEGTDNFYEALDEFMDYLQHPYFTDKNVEKEKGIIAQEINMYKDSPDWEVYMNSLENMYHNSPIKIDIAGTVESIGEITKETLYTCYDTFYNPANMIMCLTGDFEPNKILEEVKKRLVPNKDKGEIRRINKEESKTIVKKETIKKMEVSMPLFVIGIKDFETHQKELTEEELIKKHIAIEIILNLIIGKSSKLYKNLYEEGLLMSEPYLEYEFEKRYAHIAITGKSKNPQKVLECIETEIKKIKENGISEKDFQRIKKMLYGEMVKEFDDVADETRMFVADYFKGINSFNYIENYENITLEYTKQVLENVFKEENTVISIIN